MAVTVEGLKAHLNIEDDYDDTLLALLLTEAKSWISGHIDAPFPETKTPAALDGAARQLAAHWYLNRRGDEENGAIPGSVRALCAPFIVWSF
ncbi:head-tail connector protein [Aureimonas psammosilenae]|uniref:head-tail connector protein n=1 Tax=Aureimonas psammosilenae TaxID=2495496 RepID=UPI0012612E45|nr:head-tail connector protein [Aureimonas psammosilenae]